MDIVIDQARKTDVRKLMNLYFQVYGRDYPIKIGNDARAMRLAIETPCEYLWLVGRDRDKYDKIVASTVFQLDRKTKIGRVIGVVVLPKYRGKSIAHKLISHGSNQLLQEQVDINALYTTTRTLSISGQLMFLNNDYVPLGIFPNAHKIKNYETLTLMGKFREGVLSKRKYIPVISEKLKPILKISNQFLGKKGDPQFEERASIHKNYRFKKGASEENFEFIFAPEFVKSRFCKLFQDERDDYFFPFDAPNLLISAVKSDLELYAYFGAKDHYCALIACNKSILQYGHHLEKLIFQMKDYGIAYIEALLRLDWDVSIEYLLRHRFLPSALYPALKEKDGHFYDFILLSRTMQPIDFQGMEIDSAFKPYIDQYINQWISMHVSSLSVVNKRS